MRRIAKKAVIEGRKNMHRFGERLRALMTSHGLTPETLGPKVGEKGVAPQTVRRWLKMKRCDISVPHLVSLAEIFHVRMRWLAARQGDVPTWLPYKGDADELLYFFENIGIHDKRMLVNIAALMHRDAVERT